MKFYELNTITQTEFLCLKYNAQSLDGYMFLYYTYKVIAAGGQMENKQAILTSKDFLYMDFIASIKILFLETLRNI